MPDKPTIPGKTAVSEMISADGTVLPQTPPPVIPPAPIVETKTDTAPVVVDDKKLPDKEPDKKVEKLVDDDKTIDLSDFLAVKDGIQTVPDVKPKVEDKTVTQPDPKLAALPPTRDYSDLAEEDKPIFEHMNNEAFAKLKPIYLEYKKKDAEIAELRKGRIPDNYAEHKNAVVLTPEFEEASAGVNYANAISKHWEDQFDKVKAGEETYQTIHIDDKTGQLFLSEPVAVDKTTETKLLKYVTWAQNQALSKQTDLNAIIKSHQNKHAEVKNWINDYEKKAFSLFDKEEGKELKTIANDTLKSFPAALQANPILPMLVKSMVLVSVLGKKLQQTAIAPKTTQQTVKVNGNLSAAEIAGDSASKGVATKVGDDIEDFKRFKEGVGL